MLCKLPVCEQGVVQESKCVDLLNSNRRQVDELTKLHRHLFEKMDLNRFHLYKSDIHVIEFNTKQKNFQINKSFSYDLMVLMCELILTVMPQHFDVVAVVVVAHLTAWVFVLLCLIQRIPSVKFVVNQDQNEHPKINQVLSHNCS